MSGVLRQPKATASEIREAVGVRPSHIRMAKRAIKRARGRKPEPGKLNGTEQRYLEEHLTPLESRGWKVLGFESIKLRLADRTYYTPDFPVLNAELELEFHEVKGFWQDDARVKIKVAAEQFPHFKFLAASPLPKKQGGGWEFEEF